MGILRLLRVFIIQRFGRQVFGGIIFPDIVAHGGHCFVGNPVRVGTHICDQADGAFFAQLNAFVEFLGDTHGFLGGKSQRA